MAQRRSLFNDALPMPASPMTPKGGSQTTYGEPQSESMAESKETFRRRTTPVVGSPAPIQTTLQEILAMLRPQ
jgi:hypothetical protein